MIPKNIYVVQQTNNTYLGHLGKKSSVFGFVKLHHAMDVKTYLEKKQFVVSKVDPCYYIIKNKPPFRKIVKKSRPSEGNNNINIAKMSPDNIVMEMVTNNLNFELIDDINTDGDSVLLQSNFEFSIPEELHDMIVRKRLDALYNDQPFSIEEFLDDEE
jgi:hypothetical protein